MKKKEKKTLLPVGTIVQDKDYPEDKGIIVEVGCIGSHLALRSAYRVYAISGFEDRLNKSTVGWYDKEYIESCKVLARGNEKRGGR